MSNPFDDPMSVQFDFETGALSPCQKKTVRRVSDLSMMFYDSPAVERAILEGDPAVYEILDEEFISSQTDMVLGVTRIFPGKVGNEYHFTKGHFHAQDNQAEMYFCTRGKGYLLLERESGEFQVQPWFPGAITHIPPGWGHRVVNTGRDTLIFVSCFHLSAGHKYEPVVERGFASVVVEQDGQPAILPNPRRA